LLLLSRFQGSHFAQASQVPLSLTELGGQKCLYEIPGHCRSNGSSAHAKDVHVVVLDALPRREMIVDQGCTNARNLVCADRSAYAAATDCAPAIHFPPYPSPGQWNDEVGIVVVWSQGMSAEINDLMARGAELS